MIHVLVTNCLDAFLPPLQLPQSSLSSTLENGPAPPEAFPPGPVTALLFLLHWGLDTQPLSLIYGRLALLSQLDPGSAGTVKAGIYSVLSIFMSSWLQI